MAAPNTSNLNVIKTMGIHSMTSSIRCIGSLDNGSSRIRRGMGSRGDPSGSAVTVPRMSPGSQTQIRKENADQIDGMEELPGQVPRKYSGDHSISCAYQLHTSMKHHEAL